MMIDKLIDGICKKSVKAQHEIVGFVLIVLVVSVIGVIFLSITLGNPNVEKGQSIEISNLLEASMYHTTSCAVNYVPQYRNVQDLIKECYKDQTGNLRVCLGGGDVCDQLERDLKKIYDDGLVVGDDSPNKAYKVDIYFTSDDELPNENILSFSEGNFANCTSLVGGSHPIPVSSFGFGKIETELLVCKN